MVDVFLGVLFFATLGGFLLLITKLALFVQRHRLRMGGRRELDN